MLKKAAIIVATAAASLLALSPLAFAGEDHQEGDDVTQINSIEQDHSQEALVNTGGSTGDTNTNTATQECGNGTTNSPSVTLPTPPAPVAPVVAPADALLGVLAPAPVSGSADASSEVNCDQTSSAGDSFSQTNSNE
ncbi:hypothetical protein ACVGVM_12665 [Pseudonocardia bannensis]|uniref:Secreted protein n=1 Tax=Pseudonocardia bannensis TaxID=630973 RepID=A0A848DLJ7_9PSEU|nr:hypothetical protein [Pseudonocardia bannensis]NMH93588.1 hypothetical protein [Pseudonocardia bannensis]